MTKTAHLIGDELVWLPNALPNKDLENIDLKELKDRDTFNLRKKFLESIEAAIVKELINKYSPYQVGNIVEIDCKECGRSGLRCVADEIGEYCRIGTNSVCNCPACPDCIDGQQSYKITGPIELKQFGGYEIKGHWLSSMTEKGGGLWLCVSKAERIDK